MGMVLGTIKDDDVMLLQRGAGGATEGEVGVMARLGGGFFVGLTFEGHGVPSGRAVEATVDSMKMGASGKAAEETCSSDRLAGVGVRKLDGQHQAEPTQRSATLVTAQLRLSKGPLGNVRQQL